MFEPEELMARIVDLEAQLKVIEMAPPAAEQLIACLEGEIAKRDARIVDLEADLAGTQSRVLVLQDQWRQIDAELAAIKAQEPVEYQLRALIRDVTNIPEAGYYMPQSWHDQVIALSLSGQLDAPVSEAKAQGVVMPERKKLPDLMMAEYHEVRGWNACLDEVARLNAAPAAPAADAWIPVGERLPEPGEPVQVWCEGAEQPGLAWVSRHADWSGEWVIPEPQAIGYESITHWMPLPAGPAANRAKGVV